MLNTKYAFSLNDSFQREVIRHILWNNISLDFSPIEQGYSTFYNAQEVFFRHSIDKDGDDLWVIWGTKQYVHSLIQCFNPNTFQTFTKHDLFTRLFINKPEVEAKSTEPTPELSSVSIAKNEASNARYRHFKTKESSPRVHRKEAFQAEINDTRDILSI